MDLNELAKQGDHHKTQIFYPYKDIINLSVNLFTRGQTGKYTVNIGNIKDWFSKDYYHVGFSNGKQQVLAYQ